ncbi:MAG: 6-hydroxymethylpterin diphosphokinase MptE-like protein, partial [Halobacteria archaeon]|nr:6-hydroxymethylpterin diphosphokinase MptE-like protein [Halobacteria archaeon]
ILEEFGYSRAEDEKCARLLDSYLDNHDYNFDLKRLNLLMGGENVVVAGNAPSLLDDWRKEYNEYVVIAADGACARLHDKGVLPDVVCTDLDGAPEPAAELSHLESVSVVHAHGDNAELVEEYVSEFDLENVVGTTQARPFAFENLHNFGGFTDGDRAAFLADEFDAERIELMGFDFEDSTVSDEKKRKLDWARRLLEYLGEKRGEELIN